MTIQELTATLKKIEVKGRKLSEHIFADKYHSAFKGSGMIFSEVREYAYGDEIKNIDWNVSARFGHPYVKVFEEEREQLLLLLIDTSASTLFGTNTKSKQTLITEIAATLVFSALTNGDKVGAIFFSNTIEKVILPKRGKQQILKVLQQLLTVQPSNNSTDINMALQHLMQLYKRSAIVFLISDFIAPDYAKLLKIVGNKHDLCGIYVSDPAEAQFPKVGLLPMLDVEKNSVVYAQTNNSSFQEQWQKQHALNLQATKQLFTTANAGFLNILTNADMANQLHNYFSKL